MSSEQLYFFDVDTCRPIDAIGPNGRGVYGNKSIDEVKQEYVGPVLQLTSEDIVKRTRDRYISEPKEVTKEDWWNLLECLPPCKWTRNRNTESFFMSERYTYDITTWCVRIGDRYFTFLDRDTLNHDDVVAKVMAAISAPTQA